MTKIVAVGGYAPWDAEGLAAIGAQRYPTLQDLTEAPEAARAAVRVVAFAGHSAFGPEAMDRLPGLGLIANFGVGFDAIDVGAASARDIRVTNTPDVLNDDVADLAVGMLIAQQREFRRGEDWVRSGSWAASGAMPLARKVSGRRAGICGLGRIGREIADRLAAFKMEIHYHSRSEKETPGWTYHADPVSLCAAVDYLIVAVVGGPETENYVTRDALEALGPEGVLVNISRGTTVDEAAMLDLLERGQLGGAALDVFRGEPDIDPRFLALDTVVLQPHVGSATETTRRAMGQLQRDNITAFLAGQALLTPVN